MIVMTNKIFYTESHLPKGWYSALRSLDFHQDFTYFVHHLKNHSPIAHKAMSVRFICKY